MTHLWGYLIRFALIYETKMFRIFPDHKYDDAYIMEEETEPVIINIFLLYFNNTNHINF